MNVYHIIKVSRYFTKTGNINRILILIPSTWKLKKEFVLIFFITRHLLIVSATICFKLLLFSVTYNIYMALTNILFVFVGIHLCVFENDDCRFSRIYSTEFLLSFSHKSLILFRGIWKNTFSCFFIF